MTASQLVGVWQTSGIYKDVLQEFSVAGVIVREVLVSWASYAQMSVASNDLELHYRVGPTRVYTPFRIIGTASRVGRISLNPPDIPFTGIATSACETVHLVTCTFERDFLERALDNEINWGSVDPRYYLDFDRRDIHDQMRRLAKEFLAMQQGYKLLVPALAISTGIDLVRHISSMSGKRHYSLDQDRIAIAKDIISDTDAQIRTISDLSRRMGLSASHLGRLFKQETNQSLGGFLEEKRFVRAQQLLTETDHPLKVISFMTGYSQSSAFTFAFKRRFGIAPSTYRRNHRT